MRTGVRKKGALRKGNKGGGKRRRREEGRKTGREGEEKREALL